MLTPARIDRALAARGSPLSLFVRDDDGGWDTPALERLLARCAEAQLPIDVAVIPDAADDALAAALARQRAAGASVRVHQHGFRHENHQREGRRCEFGDARGADAQRDDIDTGRATLRTRLGDVGDPIFTPPWNRCSADTPAVLAQLGFAALSRDCTASPLPAAGLRELPVHVDWQRRRDGAPLPPAAFAAYVERALVAAPVCGLMLHHATITTDERDALFAFVHHLHRHPAVRFIHMRDALAGDAP